MRSVGRVIAIGEGGRAQAPVRDDRFRAVLEIIAERELLDKKVLSPECRDWDHADEVRRAIYRSARHFCSCGKVSCTRRHRNYPVADQPAGCPRGGKRISVDADVVKDEDGKFYVQILFRDKAAAMRHVIETYGPDPNNWPYNPWAKRVKAEQ